MGVWQNAALFLLWGVHCFASWSGDESISSPWPQITSSHAAVSPSCGLRWNCRAHKGEQTTGMIWSGIHTRHTWHHHHLTLCPVECSHTDMTYHLYCTNGNINLCHSACVLNVSPLEFIYLKVNFLLNLLGSFCQFNGLWFVSDHHSYIFRAMTQWFQHNNFKTHCDSFNVFKIWSRETSLLSIKFFGNLEEHSMKYSPQWYWRTVDICPLVDTRAHSAEVTKLCWFRAA